MQGYDPADPVCVDRPAEPVSNVLDRGVGRAAHRLGRRVFPSGRGARGTGRAGRGSPRRSSVTETITIPEAQRARSAAYVITTTEGAALHLERLRTRPDDFDADVRDRLIAGALVPAAAVAQAQKFRRWYRERNAEACSSMWTRSWRPPRPAWRR